MSNGTEIAVTNARVYASPARAQWYGTLSELTAAEQAELDLTHSKWRGGDLLEIGVGGGRTSQYLAPEAHSYVGADYSQAMISVVKARYPDLDYRQADARDLSIFPDRSFDFAFFPDNGVDAVGNSDRTRILAEVHRVLRPGGVAVLSSHNRDWSHNNIQWRQMFRVRFSSSTLTTATSLIRPIIRLRNYLGVRSRQQHTETYDIRLDPGNDFASPHYYVGADEMRRQLEAAGLVSVQVLNAAGELVGPALETSSASLLYLAHRP